MSWKVRSGFSHLSGSADHVCPQVAPGLLAGNTIIIKPSPLTPLATIKFVELAQQVLPPGVLSVLSGDDDLCVFPHSLLRHPIQSLMRPW